MFSEESYFERMSHEISNPYLWVIIFILSLRSEYTCLKHKDYGHAAAFALVLIVSGYFAAVGLGWLPGELLEKLFN